MRYALKKYLLLLIYINTCLIAQSSDSTFNAPKFTMDATVFNEYLSIGSYFPLIAGKDVYIGLSYGFSFEGGTKPTGTEIDMPFSWFTSQKDFVSNNWVGAGTINYLVENSIMIGIGLEYSTQKIYYQYRSNATGWDWYRHKEDKERYGGVVSIAYFLPPKYSIYLKMEYGSIRGIMLGAGFKWF